MPDISEYRKQLEAKIVEQKSDRDFNNLMHDKSIGGDDALRPDDDMIKRDVGELDQRTDDEIGMQAWSDLQQEQGDVYARYQDEQAQKQEEQQQQRDIAEQKIRDEEIKKEKQREVTEQERIDADAKELQQAARADEAQREKEQAAVNLAEQERTATKETEVSSYRDQFQQAAERNQSIDRDIE